MNNLDQFITQGQIASALLIIAVALTYIAFGRKPQSLKKSAGH